MVAAPAMPKKPNARKRKSSPISNKTDFSSFRDNGGASSDGPDDFPDAPSFGKRREPFSSEDESFPTPAKRFKAENGAGINLVRATAKVGKLQVDDFEDEFENEYGPVDLDIDMDTFIKTEETPISLSTLQSSTKNGIKKETTGTKLKTEEPAGPPSWLAVHANLPVVTNDSVGSGESNLLSTRVQALEDDGSLRLFWLDYLEADGKIYLVGKILDKATNRYVSAAVTVENMQRNLFVLPRERRMEDNHETDVQPDQIDVFRDFDEVRRQFKIGGFKAKWVNRRYAFGEPGVPTAETSWLKVIYPFSGECNGMIGLVIDY
jgi:DNA polymerase alpha subunit A